MKAEKFLECFRKLGCDFYTGVPDSQLKPLCDYIYAKEGIGEKHIIAANEGAAVGLAAGHFLSTGRPAMVYMQNSGIGNAVNPICSLLNEKVYAIPVIFVIGWRGEPGKHDEPQHVFQGEITEKLLQCLDIPYWILTADTRPEELEQWRDEMGRIVAEGRSVAVVVRKGAFESEAHAEDESPYPMSREEAVSLILEQSESKDVFVCTTGKLSREVFEYREAHGKTHDRDFLTVGSMGHSLMIALGIALQDREHRVFCLDGDGAMLMHMGSLVISANHAPESFVHVVVHNGAHESVGGMPVDSRNKSLAEIAKSCGYRNILRAENESELREALRTIREAHGAAFLEVFCNLNVRSDLGRPTTTPQENRDALMRFLRGE